MECSGLDTALAARLPDYMLPRTTLLPALPLLVNGKPDRQALLARHEQSLQCAHFTFTDQDLEVKWVKNYTVKKILTATNAILKISLCGGFGTARPLPGGPGSVGGGGGRGRGHPPQTRSAGQLLHHRGGQHQHSSGVDDSPMFNEWWCSVPVGVGPAGGGGALLQRDGVRLGPQPGRGGHSTHQECNTSITNTDRYLELLRN